MNRNDFHSKRNNRRTPFATKLTQQSHLIKIQRQNGSLESREERTSNNRVSRQKFITKQLSNGQLKPSLFAESRLFSVTMANKNYYSETINKQNSCIQDEYIKNINNQIKHKLKPNPLESNPNLLSPEILTSPHIKYKNIYHNMFNFTNNQFYNRNTHTRNEYINSHFGIDPLKCEEKYCNQEAVCFGQRKDTGEDYLRCINCKEKQKDKRISWRIIQKLKIPQCPQIRETIKKFQNVISKVAKSQIAFQQHKKSFLSQFQYQIIEHNNYYNSLCQIIQKRRKETLNTLQAGFKNAEYQFSEIKKRLTKYNFQLPKLFSDLLMNSNRICEMNQSEKKHILNKFLSHIPEQQSITKVQLSFYQVNTNYNAVQFQNDINKYFLQILQKPQNTDDLSPCGNSVAPTSPNPYNDSSNQLICEQQFQWGQKPKPNKTYPQVKQIYFSFQKHNDIIYQNSQEYVSSPGFKQI